MMSSGVQVGTIVKTCHRCFLAKFMTVLQLLLGLGVAVAAALIHSALECLVVRLWV